MERIRARGLYLNDWAHSFCPYAWDRVINGGTCAWRGELPEVGDALFQRRVPRPTHDLSAVTRPTEEPALILFELMPGLCDGHCCSSGTSIEPEPTHSIPASAGQQKTAQPAAAAATSKR